MSGYNFSDVLRSIFFYLVMGIVALIVGLPALILALLPENWRRRSMLSKYITRFVLRSMAWSARLRVEYVGLENIPKSPAIYVANHQSAMDIPIIMTVARNHPTLWFFTKDLTRFPIFGFIMRRMGIMVDYESRTAAGKALLKAVRILKKGKQNCVIFPEGGRYYDGKVHEFFGGFVTLARESGLPTVPVRIFGTYKVYSPFSLLVRSGKICVKIGKPITYGEGFEGEAFAEEVHRRISQESLTQCSSGSFE